MKYKRRKEKPLKYIRCDFEKKYKIKKAGFLRKTLTSAVIVIIVLALTRSGIVKNEQVKNFISTDSPIAGTNLNELVEDTAKEVSSVYLQRFKNSKPDKAYAKKESDKLAASDSDEKEKLFSPKNPCVGRLSSPFGERVHPVSGEVKFHNGIDIAAPKGTDVVACADGKIDFAGYNSSSGNYVIINHENGYTSSYAHMQEVKCKTGDVVKKGDLIGLVGNTGISTGPHLHFEIRHNGSAVNPRNYIEG